MKKITKELLGKTIEELQKEARVIREEVAKLQVESKVKPQKDTNTIPKKIKKLAVILTVISEKELGITI